MTDTALRRTPLHQLHLEHGGRMVPFAGYEMPVRYEGVVAEHEHTRTSASLFDVAHMGVVELHGPDRIEALEALVPAALAELEDGRVRYTFFTNDEGGVLDDLMVTRLPDHLTLVVNASRRAADLAHLRENLAGEVEMVERADLGLLALQGPRAAEVLASFEPSLISLPFMSAGSAVLGGESFTVSRSGYTGEDGFELIVPATAAVAVAELLLDRPEVSLAGLGARDSLRLEAGLCLYGNDLDETTTPVEAGLAWAIQKRRRVEGGFPGDTVIVRQLAEGTERRRVGIRPGGRAPVRDGAPLADGAGNPVGTVTSGGYGPTVEGPVAMGYVGSSSAVAGTPLIAEVRGKEIECTVADLPFVPYNYHRG